MSATHKATTEEKQDDKPSKTAAHHGHQIRFVGETNDAVGVTKDTTYSVIDWLGLSGHNVQALILDDNGKLLAVEGVQNAERWEYVQHGKHGK